MLSPPFFVKTRPMPIESAKYATTIAQSIAERFMDALWERETPRRPAPRSLQRPPAPARASPHPRPQRAPDRSCCVRASGIHAIREENNVQVVLRSDPEGRAGESRVPERRSPHEMTCRAVRARRIPPERSARERRVSDGREERDRLRASETPAADRAAVEIGAGQPREIMRRAEQSRVAGHLAERVRVLVVHLADEMPAAPRIDLRRRDAGRSETGGL